MHKSVTQMECYICLLESYRGISAYDLLFCRVGFVNKMAVIHWNDFKLRQLNGCRILRIFINQTKKIAFIHRSHRFGRHSGKYLIALRLECAPVKPPFQGPFSPNTAPSPFICTRQPTPKRGHAKWSGRAEWWGQRGEMGLSHRPNSPVMKRWPGGEFAKSSHNIFLFIINKQSQLMLIG